MRESGDSDRTGSDHSLAVSSRLWPAPAALSDATPRGRSRGREDGASSHLPARPPARVADTIKADGDLAESPLIPATDISTMAITGEMNALYYSAVSAARRWLRAHS